MSEVLLYWLLALWPAMFTRQAWGRHIQADPRADRHRGGSQPLVPKSVDSSSALLSRLELSDTTIYKR